MDVGADRRSIVAGGGDRGEGGFRSAATPPAPDPRSLAERAFLDPGSGIPWSAPSDAKVVRTGEGEWFITLRVLRDLGIAFAVGVVGIFGVLASTVFTLAVVPAVYFLVYANRPGHGLLRRMPLE